MEYQAFLERKSQFSSLSGFAPLWMPDFLFEFQKVLVEWALVKGRAAIFADCGLGKTAMQLVWAENVVRKTNKPVLILTPLAVGSQTVAEGEKFGIDCERSSNGTYTRRIVVANYERLHYFNPHDFAGCVCDESSILKNFDGVRRGEITEFMKKLPYRLLCTATAAPNDYIELGTSSEALGELGYTDMLTRFFKNEQNTIKPMVYRNKGQNYQGVADRNKWRFKGHAEIPFWQWVCSWARAIRSPADLGFHDARFILPELREQEHLVKARTLPDGMLFAPPAISLPEQREERRRTLPERCERMAALVTATTDSALLWCNLNDEGDLLERLIPGAVQVRGADAEDFKEEQLRAFADGRNRVLITKPKIGAWGLNFQRCAHVLFFPTHSYEQYYQGVRRCWRFGQLRPVTVDIILTEGEEAVMRNLRRKAVQADRMFTDLVTLMTRDLRVERGSYGTLCPEVPVWLS